MPDTTPGTDVGAPGNGVPGPNNAPPAVDPPKFPPVMPGTAPPKQNGPPVFVNPLGGKPPSKMVPPEQVEEWQGKPKGPLPGLGTSLITPSKPPGYFTTPTKKTPYQQLLDLLPPIHPPISQDFSGTVPVK